MRPEPAINPTTIGEIQNPQPLPDNRRKIISNVPDGCDYSPSCFNCPLPQCRHDYPNHRLPDPTTVRRAAIINEHNLDIADIIHLWPMSRRNAHRLIATARDLVKNASPPNRWNPTKQEGP